MRATLREREPTNNETGQPAVTRWLGILAIAVALTASAQEPTRPTTYEVGPGRPFSDPIDVPWNDLRPGDVVRIHAKANPYRSRWQLSAVGTPAQPIRVIGVPSATGELPVIVGAGAVSPPNQAGTNERRGIVNIGPRTGDASPQHIVVEGLEIRGARPGNSFTGRAGATEYRPNAAAIYVVEGDSITIRRCVLQDCAIGFFTAPGTSRIVLQHCELTDNGGTGALLHQPHAYTESESMTYEHNRFGPLRAGSRGNAVKDRSSNVVVRYNWIEGGNRQLDLVEGSEPHETAAFVYGNVLIELAGPGNDQIVHYGGDQGEPDSYRRGPLLFYHNTVLSHRTDQTTLLRLSGEDVRAELWNNVFATTAPGRSLALLEGAGFARWTHNWLPDGFVRSHGEDRGTMVLTDNTVGANPGFRSLATTDLRLTDRSPAVDRGRSLPAEWRDHEVRFEPNAARDERARVDPGRPDLGAFGSGASEDPAGRR